MKWLQALLKFTACRTLIEMAHEQGIALEEEMMREDSSVTSQDVVKQQEETRETTYRWLDKLETAEPKSY
jgi:hypothetical protein